MTFSLDDLRRWPDLEGPDLLAADAADRLILDESAAARARVPLDEIAVVEDSYGALTLGAAAAGPPGSGAVRVHQDTLVGERALEANAERAGLAGAVRWIGLSAEGLDGAHIVLLRLPKSLDALRDIAGSIAAHAAPDVTVFAGGRLKHMTVAMNDVLAEFFLRVDVTHARQKSRVLIARGPQHGHDPRPQQRTHDGLVVCAFGGVFAGPAIDIGTRFLLAQLPEVVADDGAVVDLACGTGVVAAWLARRHPHLVVHATDQSAAAVASARATAEANGLADRIAVVRDDALSTLPEASASFIALNPPFHSGVAVHTGLAAHLFADAARALRPGRELWTVWNSALGYRPTLERIVGPTRQVARNTKFTVTASVRR
ncbi:class I SAM-dependent methyltransferase [Microbacterium sp. 18062]|uniref:class I SAM-dependent methyltransferase n=1 Tax=Microbacterium sp. 18062 TaxID=2681410 RepID=UPI00135686D3|nr:methyltransferase [Microbacterium sp. 18062]